MTNTVHSAKKKYRHALYFQNSEHYLSLLCVGRHTVIISIDYCIDYCIFQSVIKHLYGNFLNTESKVTIQVADT